MVAVRGALSISVRLLSSARVLSDHALVDHRRCWVGPDVRVQGIASLGIAINPRYLRRF